MKILVIGESCEDKFIYGYCDRLCPKSPVPIFNPKYETINKGMAGNVVENLKSLGYNPDFITNKEDIKKTRYIDLRTNQMIVRIDENDKIETSLKIDYSKLSKYDLIIISDYDKGFMTKENIQGVSIFNKNVFLDTKKQLDEYFSLVKFIKVNELEYEKTKNTTIGLEDKLLITLGPEGCRYKDITYPVLKKIETIDISGAGDTFISSFSIKYTKTKNIEESIKYAQECSSIVIQKKGVVTI